MTTRLFTSADIVEMTTEFLAEQGFGDVDVSLDSDLGELGLDSIAAVLMLTTHQVALADGGYPVERAKGDLPPIFTVGDMADFLLGVSPPSEAAA